jgi:hypothetical protein
VRVVNDFFKVRGTFSLHLLFADDGLESQIFSMSGRNLSWSYMMMPAFGTPWQYRH